MTERKKSERFAGYLSRLKTFEETHANEIEVLIEPDYSKPLIDFIINRIPGINSSEKYDLRRNVPGPLIVVGPGELDTDSNNYEESEVTDIGRTILEEAVVDALVSRLVFPLVRRYPSLNVSRLYTGNDLLGSLISGFQIQENEFLELYSRILFLDDKQAKQNWYKY